MSEQKERKVGLFEFINDIGHDKKYLLDEDTQSAYDVFMINRAFAQQIDTVLIANEMNKRYPISKLMHHDFMFYSINAAKRYGKWSKKSEEQKDLIEYLKEKYSIGDERAVEYIAMMSPDYIEELNNKMNNRGGKK